jgi:solute carrier family 50 protein (sugar transporter)
VHRKEYLQLNTMGVQMKVAITVIPVILVFCITAAISLFSFHDHHHRKIFVGSVALVASVVMYGSPLVVVVRHLYLFLIHHIHPKLTAEATTTEANMWHDFSILTRVA